RRTVQEHFEREYPDIAAALPYAADEVVRSRPALLKVVDCAPYNYGRAVLVGDSAHTIVPFFGQGINCSFEDADVLCELLDKYLTSGVSRHEAIRAAGAEFSERRVAAGQAISKLSMANLKELSQHIADDGFHRRKRLERELHERHPDDFTQLYQMVAFTRTPYDEIVRRSRIDAMALDLLCEWYDPDTQADMIIGSYPEIRRGLGEDGHREPTPALAAAMSSKGEL
ncbi:MAG TPA: FAD-dependent monooxygenase, partial [Actinoplanes sp.]